MVPTKARIIFPLANDAKKDLKQSVYTNIGPNMMGRLEEAQQWIDRYRPLSWVWVAAAGTDVAFRRGRTLGAWAAAFIRRSDPLAKVITNVSDYNFYGTYEEIKWGVREVGLQYKPGTVEFVFFAPWWHLARVRLIWKLFHEKEWGKVRFVSTRDGARFKLLHELKAWLRIVAIWREWVASRDMTQYPE